MRERILFVDDERNFLLALRRRFRREFELDIADSPELGLEMAKSADQPYAVVISDMKMPGMQGSEFLAEFRRISPHTVRMILSGQAEMDDTIDAVNKGHIFRFLTKPFTAEALVDAVKAALEQHRLVTAEQELLEETLTGTIRLMTDILSWVSPEVFSQGSRLRKYSESVAQALDLPNQWQIGVAAMLSQLGSIAIPPKVLAAHESGEALDADQQRLLESHPEIASKLLSNIPRLETVASIIRRQSTPSRDPASMPSDPHKWPTPLLGGEILRCVLEFDRLAGRDMDSAHIIEKLQKMMPPVPSFLIEAVRHLEISRSRMKPSLVTVKELMPTMVLDEHVLSKKDVLLVAKGQEVNTAMILRLSNFAAGDGVVEPIRVRIPRHLARSQVPA
ncbi:MAG TPA: HD domain-containing phosphohydrolase [Acidobacteriota bacterium]|nr:HD domain-containing phosphohydrolase [Acidobacteriota bacterium]